MYIYTTSEIEFNKRISQYYIGLQRQDVCLPWFCQWSRRVAVARVQKLARFRVWNFKAYYSCWRSTVYHCTSMCFLLSAGDLISLINKFLLLPNVSKKYLTIAKTCKIKFNLENSCLVTLPSSQAAPRKTLGSDLSRDAPKTGTPPPPPPPPPLDRPARQCRRRCKRGVAADRPRSRRRRPSPAAIQLWRDQACWVSDIQRLRHECIFGSIIVVL